MTATSKTPGEPLGPDPLTRKYFGDVKYFSGVRTGIVQGVGRRDPEHAILMREPLQRVTRSMYPIVDVVYDDNRAAQTSLVGQESPHHDQGR